ncbi:MAG TPA: AbrB/MazE/SpoVT family DNA-binding domain-containing protein [Edaphobacter sp.]|nr:AbrB/MazE/SpoVT family DNA-binding domain-containing protein [Edaphobacter sp.]
MESLIATVSTKGQLVIPAEMREVLGIVSGSRVALTLEGDLITLRPVSERLVDETCGMFAGGPSLTDELQRERRSEKW